MKYKHPMIRTVTFSKEDYISNSSADAESPYQNNFNISLKQISPHAVKATEKNYLVADQNFFKDLKIF